MDEQKSKDEYETIQITGNDGGLNAAEEELHYIAKQLEELKRFHPNDYKSLLEQKETGKTRRTRKDSKDEKFVVLEIEEIWDAVEKANRYLMKYNANGTNAIISVSDKELKDSTKNGGDAVARRDSINFTMTIEAYEKLQAKRARWTAGCKKTFDYACYMLTRQNRHNKAGNLNRWAHIDFEKFAEMRGEDITPFDDTPEEKKRAKIARKNFIAKVKKELLVLCAVRAEWTDSVIKKKDGKRKAREKMTYNATLFGDFRYKDNFLEVEFGEALANYLCRETAYIMQFPSSLFRTSEKLPVAYEAGEYLSRLWSINERKGNRCGVVSVLKLIENCGDLPRVEDVRNGKREYTKVLREPLERALNYLATQEISFFEPLRQDEKGNPVFWAYCMPDGAEFQGGLDANDFLNASIKYQMKDKANDIKVISKRRRNV